METNRLLVKQKSDHYFSQRTLQKKDQERQRRFRNRSFYLGEVQSLERATIGQFDEISFEDHFIICGIVSGMRNLLLPLRSKSLQKVHKIIILYNEQLPSRIWKQINRFPEVYFLQGSPLKPEFLQRACINKARGVVILSNFQDGSDGETNSTNKNMADADTIVIYKTVRHICKNSSVRIITELSTPSVS